MDAIPADLPDALTPQQPARNLWASVILQALGDTQSPKHRDEARQWLAGAYCRAICELLGIDHARLARRAG